MPELAAFKAPAILDGDIPWVCDLLKLPPTAFTGDDGKNPRREVLKTTETIDVEACPGSGKTTLLVAKLAILARRWGHCHRGICVLSHTNAARHEIELGLGNTAEGRRLLSYPHFVGTIHAFVNQFLASPWLRSVELPVRVVDDQLCEKHRRELLSYKKFTTLRNYVDKKEKAKINVVAGWRVKSRCFDVIKKNGEHEFKDASAPSNKQLQALAKACAKDGYFCYDEMFFWANDLLGMCPEIRSIVRERFPMLFIDEVQDNSETQSALLSKLFVEGGCPAIRQRFGDTNQAIYQHAGESEGATTDAFPTADKRKDIPHSLRFGQEIARLANGFGLVPQGLKGCGPRTGLLAADTNGKHAIFLFNNDNIHRVLATYAEYLLETFSADDLREGSFVATAIGAVHTQGEDKKKFPSSVGDYWPRYDPEISRAEPAPKTFFQYLMAGRGKGPSEKAASHAVEAHHAVEAVAAGVLRLATLFNPTAEIGLSRRKHRQVLELLASNSAAKAGYLEIATKLTIDENGVTADEWEKKWSDILCKVATAIAGDKSDPSRAKEFLAWEPSAGSIFAAGKPSQKDNVFRHPTVNPMVSIRLGSIHSTKGQTHTATLVFETSFHELHLSALKPWLLGEKTGGDGQGKRNISRLKQHYVAMTRPTHLLCLAMRQDSLDPGEIETLKSKSGWRVARLAQCGVEWF